jgi:hypothetical protein
MEYIKPNLIVIEFNDEDDIIVTSPGLDRIPGSEGDKIPFQF